MARNWAPSIELLQGVSYCTMDQFVILSMLKDYLKVQVMLYVLFHIRTVVVEAKDLEISHLGRRRTSSQQNYGEEFVYFVKTACSR